MRTSGPCRCSAFTGSLFVVSLVTQPPISIHIRETRTRKGVRTVYIIIGGWVTRLVSSLDQLAGHREMVGVTIYVNVYACALCQWPHPYRLARQFHEFSSRNLHSLPIREKFLPRKFPTIRYSYKSTDYCPNCTQKCAQLC